MVILLDHVDHQVVQIARAGEVGGEGGQPRVVALEAGIDRRACRATGYRPSAGLR